MNAVPPPGDLQRPDVSRLVAAQPQRRAPSSAAIAWRRRAIGAVKWLLPLLALLLLSSIALWPEIARMRDHAQRGLRRALQLEAEAGLMRDPRYHGIDERGRPYTVTASSAQQLGSNRVNLENPKGDLVTEGGTWVMGEAKRGVFIQHQSMMDLAQDVVLYREDGTRLYTDTATMDLKTGAAASADNTHAEGPFGTLDASEGFALVDKGAVIQFNGPSHLVLNGSDAK